MATIERRVVIESSLQSFLEACKALWADGWEMDGADPPMVYMFQYKVGMIREVLSDQEVIERKSRGEILAKARAAKAEKRRAEAAQA